MKRKTLGLIHTSATLVPVFQQLCQARLPQVDVFNIVDDSLVRAIERPRGPDARHQPPGGRHIWPRPRPAEPTTLS